MFENYGIQQIKSVVIKTINPVKIGERQYGPKEVILYLTDVEAGKLDEEKNIRSAEGGQQNPRLIQWLTHHNVNFIISKGVMSKRDLNFLLDSNIINKEEIIISTRENHTVDSSGKVRLQHMPVPGIYCYDDKGNKIYDIVRSEYELTIGEDYVDKEITVDYSFIIEDAHIYSVGENFLSDIVVQAEIYFLLKDDNEGEEYTGILTIPTANIVGDINLIMGKKATPIVGDFAIQSVQSKTKSRDENSNYTLKILSKDIDEI